MITILEEKRQVIERDLDRRIEAEGRMARRRAILASIPGIGPRISSLLVVEMPELGSIDRKAVALAGLAPPPVPIRPLAGPQRHLRRAPLCASRLLHGRPRRNAILIATCETPENPPRPHSSPSPDASPPSKRTHQTRYNLQTSTPSFDTLNTVARSRRSALRSLDCFASLAMTIAVRLNRGSTQMQFTKKRPAALSHPERLTFADRFAL
jgi:hypothetical protein